MRISSSAATHVALLIGLVGFAAPSRAIPFTLDVIQTDVESGQVVGSFSFDEAALGCTETGADSSRCNVQGLAAGDASVSLFNLDIDNDPIIAGVVAVDNNSLATQQFTLIFSLPVAPIAPSTLTAGDVAGGVTDNTGNGATLSTVVGSALYTALIDGAPYQTLFPHPTSAVVVSPFESQNLPPGAEFGTPPNPSQPGPAVATKIGLQYDFTLTPGDAASFTGKFMVIQVPEPVTAALVALGLVGLAAAGRRR